MSIYALLVRWLAGATPGPGSNERQSPAGLSCLTPPLELEGLEDRTVPASGLLAFNSFTGDWQTAVAGDALQVGTVAHWDSYALNAVVQGDFTGDGLADVAGWSNLGFWLVSPDVAGGTSPIEQ